jgi:hypothetical protein
VVPRPGGTVLAAGAGLGIRGRNDQDR